MVLNTVPRALHGGMYSDLPARLVPDSGDGWVPSTAWNSGGFRVARTVEAQP